MNSKIVNRIILSVAVAAILLLSSCVSTTGGKSKNKSTVKLNYTYLTAEECAQKLGSVSQYYAGLSQKSLDFFSQKKETTAEEYRLYSMEQACDLTEEDKAFLDKVLNGVEERLSEKGMKLPERNEFSIAFTTMNEAFGAAGYTHDTTIFLNKAFIESMIYADESFDYMVTILSHELFHTLTRNNPEFRKEMYGILNFTVNDSDFNIPEEVHALMISNPDVGHHDSYAEFTVNGEKKNCYLVFLTENEFEKPGDTFFTNMYSGLVCIDDGTLYFQNDAEDFFSVMGHNTEYCEDPEECMADNFSFAVTFGLEGPNGQGYNNPEIIEKIIEYMTR